MQPEGGPRLLITDRDGALYLERARIHVEGERVVNTSVPAYENSFSDSGFPAMTYTEFTGFTRGNLEDLFDPF